MINEDGVCSGPIIYVMKKLISISLLFIIKNVKTFHRISLIRTRNLKPSLTPPPEKYREYSNVLEILKISGMKILKELYVGIIILVRNHHLTNGTEKFNYALK